MMTQLTAGNSRTPVSYHNPAGLYDPAPNGYSHMALVNNPSRMFLLSGQGGENEQGELVPDFRAQVRQALGNLSIALAAADMRYENIARLTVLVVDHDESKLAVLGEELAQVFRGQMMPACTLIPVPRLALDGMLFELEATAYA
jgi:enamine deaminase RidA (YjgF/YER057c/UK114 family)